MNLHALDIPEDPARMPAWLERHLSGLDLARLVAELAAIHGSSQAAARSLDDVLGTQKPRVLSEGLSVLPAETLQELLRQPRLLLELQALVCREGGPYWGSSTPDAEHVAHIDRGGSRFQTFLTGQQLPGSLTLAQRPRRWYQHSGVASLATAASLLVAFAAYEHFRPQPVQIIEHPAESKLWGWLRPDALPDDVTRVAYLNRLADEGGEWLKERPTEPAELARRMNELREGCSRLIFAVHRPLTPQDRQWLVETCRVWGRKLDKQLAALESGQNTIEVRDETDALVEQLRDAFRDRAKEPA
jgi:hypothetical protein